MDEVIARITHISTDGYRGAPSGGVYIPPGSYALGAQTDLGAGTLARGVGEYMVAIGKASPVAFEEVAITGDKGGVEVTLDEVEAGVAAAAVDEVEVEAWDVAPGALDADALEALTVEDLRSVAKAHGHDLGGDYIRKDDLIALILGSDAPA